MRVSREGGEGRGGRKEGSTTGEKARRSRRRGGRKEADEGKALEGGAGITAKAIPCSVAGWLAGRQAGGLVD